MGKNKPRKIVLDLAVSLDGFIEGPHGEIDWCIMEEDMEFSAFLNGIDTIFYGRKSYELWGTYSPEKDASDMDKALWEKICIMKKFVFSKKLSKEEHEITIIRDNIPEEVMKIKKKPGKDIWLYGGASLITTFINYGLIDEYRLSVHPVILGAGKPLFISIDKRQNLKLTDTRRFSSGVVQLCYSSDKVDATK